MSLMTRNKRYTLQPELGTGTVGAGSSILLAVQITAVSTLVEPATDAASIFATRY